MNSSDSNLTPDDSPPEKPPRGEGELLDHESHLARGALGRLRGEILESLKRSADVRAWAERFPWPTLGAAAVAGIGAGWAVGSATRRQTPEEEAAEAAEEIHSAAGLEVAAEHPAGRLVSGLGTMVGTFASAAMGAATQAVVEAIKETIHESLHPEPEENDQSAPEGT